jgi:hypothetical protein
MVAFLWLRVSYHGTESRTLLPTELAVLLKLPRSHNVKQYEGYLHRVITGVHAGLRTW